VDPTQAIIIVGLISLFASTINGGLGYGYSSISVPILLLWYTNKQINPFLNIVEIILNPYVLIANRKGLTKNALRHALPVAIGLIPGVVLGVYLLNIVDPKQLKFAFYIVITPLILLQAAGFRKPLPLNLLSRGAGQTFGFGLGLLYSLTTISGPPLALLFNNQGFVKEEFRASLGLIRSIESYATFIGYLVTGITPLNIVYNPLFYAFLLPVFPGVVLGQWIVRSLTRPEDFRRICMSFDAWIVGFGFSRNVSLELALVAWQYAQFLWYAIILIDALLLYRYFKPRILSKFNNGGK